MEQNTNLDNLNKDYKERIDRTKQFSMSGTSGETGGVNKFLTSGTPADKTKKPTDKET